MNKNQWKTSSSKDQWKSPTAKINENQWKNFKALMEQRG
jgi:hypothetical protein